jgi:hypothetical protein
MMLTTSASTNNLGKQKEVRNRVNWWGGGGSKKRKNEEEEEEGATRGRGRGNEPLQSCHPSPIIFQ